MMKGMISMKKWSNQRIVKMTAIAVVCILCFAACSMPVFADADTAMSSLVDFIIKIFKYVGIIAVVIGVGMVGISLNSHDSAQRMQGFLMVGGGLLVVFADSVLTMLGITW